MEDYQEICNSLLRTLQMTNNFNDLLSLTHEKDAAGERWVTAVFASGCKKYAYVTGDNGWGMIKDVIRAIR